MTVTVWYSCHSGCLEMFVMTRLRLLWDGQLSTKRRGGWSETLSDRLVGRIDTPCVWSGGRVAVFGNVWQSTVLRDLDSWR